MAVPHKPSGYPSVSPYLVVEDAAGAIDFLCAAFGGVELVRSLDDKGRVAHAAVRVDDSVVMLGSAGDHWPALPCHVHVYVLDVDATYRRALAAGAESVQEPIRKDDPDKRGGVKAFGTTWWIATQVA